MTGEGNLVLIDTPGIDEMDGDEREQLAHRISAPTLLGYSFIARERNRRENRDNRQRNQGVKQSKSLYSR